MKVFVNGKLYDSDDAYYPLEKYTPDEIVAIFNELESKGKHVGFYSQIKYATRQR